jgi:hypothetical protein
MWISASQAKPIAIELQTPSTSKLVLQNQAAAKEMAMSQLSKGKLPERDGVYLYGQSPAPSQVGQEYVVFELRQDKVVGAFYLPQSEFSCFEGTLRSGKLALTIASNADSDPDPNATASQTPRVATAGEKLPIGNGYTPIAYPYSVALQNYHQLDSVSDGERRILQACKNKR